MALYRVIFSVIFIPCFRTSADIPDPPQCDQLLDCTWSEQGGGGHSDQHDLSGQNIPVESAVEATEFAVKAIESESRPVSLKRNKCNLEGSVAIEMSSQPLLELNPMTGSGVITSHLSLPPLLFIMPHVVSLYQLLNYS